MRTLAVGAVGLLISAPPVIADARFFTASNQGNLNSMLEISDSPYSTRYLFERTLEASVQTNNPKTILEIAERIVHQYPRSTYAWAIIADLSITSDSRRREAENILRNLDPFKFG